MKTELSEREIQVLELCAKGSTSPEIGSELKISKHTVNAHKRNIRTKTGSKTMAHAVAKYCRLNRQ